MRHELDAENVLSVTSSNARRELELLATVIAGQVSVDVQMHIIASRRQKPTIRRPGESIDAASVASQFLDNIKVRHQVAITVKSSAMMLGVAELSKI